MVQSHHRADDAVQGGERIADRQIGPHRRTVRIAGEIAQAAHRLADCAETGLVAIGPGLAESRQAQHDQPRIFRGKAVVAQTPFFHGAGAEILDHDVRIPGERAHDLLPFGKAQIDRDRFLVARLRVPPQRSSLVELAPLAQRISAGLAIGRGRLDLDDLGAEFGKHLPRERAGDKLAQFDDLDPLQRLFALITICAPPPPARACRCPRTRARRPPARRARCG